MGLHVGRNIGSANWEAKFKGRRTGATQEGED